MQRLRKSRATVRRHAFNLFLQLQDPGTQGIQVCQIQFFLLHLMRPSTFQKIPSKELAGIERSSYLEFKESNLWQHHEAGLATSDGALGLDLIDLESTEEDITHKWDLFARSKADGDWELPADGNIIHNTTCFKDYGGCRKFLKQEVCLLVHNLAKHVESGDSQ